MTHPGAYPCEGEFKSVQSKDEGCEEEPEPNYRHEPCGTEKYISGAHRAREYAWCEEAESIVLFSRIEE